MSAKSVADLVAKNNVVTFKSLSRALMVGVNESKELLSQYFHANETKLHATFLIMGRPKGSTDELRITVTPSENLKNVVEGLDDGATTHIYSVSIKRLEDHDELVNEGWSLMKTESDEGRQKCRAIEVPFIKALSESSLSRKSAVPLKDNESLKKAQSSIASNYQAASKSAGKPAATAKAKDKAKPTKKSRAASFFEGNAKKDAGKAPQLQKEPPAFAEQDDMAEIMDDAVPEVIDKPEERAQNAESIPVTVDSAAKDAANESLRKLFEEDDMVEVPALQSDAGQQLTVKEGHFHLSEKVKGVETAIRRVRRRRKVITKETRMNGKYFETIDVPGWESYSEDEEYVVHKFCPSEPSARAVNHPPNQDAAQNEEKPDSPKKAEKPKAQSKKKGADKNQKTLMSFFKK